MTPEERQSLLQEIDEHGSRTLYADRYRRIGVCIRELIAENEQLQSEQGQYPQRWETKGGDVVTVRGFVKGKHGNVAVYDRDTGGYSVIHSNDLKHRLPDEPEKPWLPEREQKALAVLGFKYVAKDPNGSAYIFERKPEQEKSGFWYGDGDDGDAGALFSALSPYAKDIHPADSLIDLTAADWYDDVVKGGEL